MSSGSHGAHREGVVDCKTMISKSLLEDSVSKVILAGEAGTGKTWMARQICEHANKVGYCYVSLWLNLNKEVDGSSLYESIAYQLSVYLEKEGSEDDDTSDEENSEDEKEQKKNDLATLQGQIQKKLEIKMFRHGKKSHRNRHFIKKNEKSYLLLVLDDEGSVTSEEQVMTIFYLKKILAHYGPVKILLTRRIQEEGATNEMKPHATDDLLDPHTIDASQVLRDTFTDNYLVVLLESLIKDVRLLESLEKSWGKDEGFLKHRIVEMSMRLPAAVVVLAKSLNCIVSKLPFSLSPEQKQVFKIALLSSFPPVSAFDYEDVEDPDRSRVTSRRNPILNLSYELLKPNGPMKSSSILDCFWHSLSFFEHCGCVYYQELIAHWILEGYFDPIISIKKAYKDGHAILMKLINRGMLKIQEDSVVMPEVAMKNLTDLRRRGLLGTSQIALAKVCGSDMTKGLGKINQVDDTIEAVQATRKGEKTTTLLVSGNRLRRESLEAFFEKLKDLEILALFKPTLDHFVPSLSKLVKLRVLVIRDFDLLKDIEELKALQGLHVLEVSGASSLKEISDEFFSGMSELQSLHLSGLHITYSPSSISLLKKLHCLIIRNCPLLKDLPDIQELVSLEVVDVSGAHGLQTCFDNTDGEKEDHSKNKNFYHLTKLEFLDFSESQIERLPIFQDSAEGKPLHSMTRLLLRNCSKLRKLPSLKPLSGLQILDLSGTSSLVKMMEVCFEEKKELKSLNLSGTSLSELPSTIEELSSLSELLLKDCTNLEVIPNITKLTNLEVIDVSGSTKLDKIEGSFEDMSYLRMVNLSGTNVETPELPKESKLCCSKRILLADLSSFEGEKWSQITEAIATHMKESASFSNEVKKYQEISEESRELGQNQSSDPGLADFPSMKVVCGERFYHVPIDMPQYQNLISFVESESHANVLEINETKSLGGFADENKENAEFVSFVNSTSTRLTSVFNEIRSVKGCWLKMCKDMEYLFSGVDEERLVSLEILSIINLQLLETISCGGSFQNLKKLSIDCCPNIKTLFLDASQLPSSLEVLHIKFCEKLEKVFEEECGNVSTLTTMCLHELLVLSSVGAKLPNLETFKARNCPKLEKVFEEDGEVSTLTTLCLYELPVLSAVAAKLPNLETFKTRNCPQLHATKENLKGSEKVMIDRNEASPQD